VRVPRTRAPSHGVPTVFQLGRDVSSFATVEPRSSRVRLVPTTYRSGAGASAPAVAVWREASTCVARRHSAKQKLAWSETSASTSVHVLPDVRITTEGPIAPDRLRSESAASRRAGGSVPSRKASFRRAEREMLPGTPPPLSQPEPDAATGVGKDVLNSLGTE
jgi:hypothetical protein